MTAPSFHRRHNDLLAALASNDEVDRIMTRLGERRGWPPAIAWRRVWGRIDDLATPTIRVLLESDDRAALCTLTVGPDGSETDPGIGRFDIALFPEDAKLSTLGAVLEAHADAEVVRYRPGKRCTIRASVDGRPGSSPGETQGYIKVFTDGRAQRLYADGRALWDAAQRGALGFAVARPLSFDLRNRSYAQAEVAGRAVAQLLGDRQGPALAYRLGRACATIPTSGLGPTIQLGPASELARTKRRGAEVIAFAPALQDRVGSVVASIELVANDLDPSPLVPIHGSPHPNQWLSTGDRLGLVDFDRLGLGDPELDVATFAAEIDFEAIDDRAAVAEAFQAGYQDVHGPVDHRRLRLYRACKQLAKVHRTIRSIRPDGDLRAAAHLHVALETVSSRALA